MTPHTRGRLADALTAMACAALAVWVHRRSAGAFFSPDDLASIERVRGLLPPHPLGWWRFLSGPGYFSLALRLFGTDPVPYHVLNLALHGVNVALLFTVVRRWGGSRLSAGVAAAWFGTSPLFEVAVQQAVGIGELLSLGFTLLAFLVADPSRPRTWAITVLAFVGALFSKESVVLMPLVLLVPCAGGTTRRRLALVGSLLVPSGSILLAFALAHGPVGGEAYATGFGLNLFHNLMTYSSWVLEYRRLTPDLGGMSLVAWRTGRWMVLGALVIAAWTWRRSSLAGAGVVWWLAALAPVLPLLHHTYQQYFYTGFGGIAIVGGEGVAALAFEARRRVEARAATPARARGRARAAGAAVVGLAVLAIGAHVVASDRLLATRWTRRIGAMNLFLDPQLRKSEFVRTVSASLAPALTAPHQRLVFLEPASSERAVRISTGQVIPGVRPHVDLITTVLDSGRVIRALHPNVDSVAFVDAWTPAYRDFDIVVNALDGRSMDLGRDRGAHEAVVAMLLQGGFVNDAVRHLDAIESEYGGDPVIQLLEARALVRAGREPDARRILTALTARPPGDSLRAAAQLLEAELGAAPNRR